LNAVIVWLQIFCRSASSDIFTMGSGSVTTETITIRLNILRLDWTNWFRWRRWPERGWRKRFVRADRDPAIVFSWTWHVVSSVTWISFQECFGFAWIGQLAAHQRKPPVLSVCKRQTTSEASLSIVNRLMTMATWILCIH